MPNGNCSDSNEPCSLVFPMILNDAKVAHSTIQQMGDNQIVVDERTISTENARCNKPKIIWIANDIATCFYRTMVWRTRAIPLTDRYIYIYKWSFSSLCHTYVALESMLHTKCYISVIVRLSAMQHLCRD